MYKAVVVGCGGRAPDHIDAYEYIENAKVVACCAPSGKRRDPLAAKYGIKAYDNAREMIQREQPDMVHLITWPNLRVEMMELVSELGVPLCTIEKPIATGVEDWRKLVALEAESDTKFAVCHQVRWQPYLVKCQQALNSGSLGNVQFIHISAGMNISGQGTHTLNYGMSVNNDAPVTSVFASASGWDTQDIGHPAPFGTEACLVFENGVTALWTSGNISQRAGDPNTTWQHVRVAAYADKGRTVFEEFGKWEIVSPHGVEGGDYGGMETWNKNNHVAQAGFHKAMFEWQKEDGRIPGTNLKQSLHEWSVILALYQSALEKRIIDMKNFDPPQDLIEKLKAVLT